jgi:hypothetical protein
MWQRGYGAPPKCYTKEITTSFSTDGRKIRTDSIKQPPPPPPAAHGTGAVHAGTSRSSDVSNRTIFKQQQALSRRKKATARETSSISRNDSTKTIRTVDTKNVPVSISKSKQHELIEQPTGEKSVALIKVLMFGFVIQSRA